MRTKSRSKRHGGASTGPTNQTFGKSHHRYVHGLRTKEVISMRKLLSERYGWKNAYYFTWIWGIQSEINAAKTKLWLGRI
ncbi:MAG: hypothetical protein ACKVH9_01105 [Rhodobacterales bacterium]